VSAKNVIVLGCGGFVGSHLVDRLMADGSYDVRGWDVSPQRIEAHLDRPNFHYHEAYVDANNTYAELGPWVGDADAVVSLAAVCNPAEYVANPRFTIRSNFIDAFRLVDLCAEHGTWLLHTSTCEVYGRTIASYLGDRYEAPELYEQVEDTTPLVMGPIQNQRWTYATAKALFERYIYAYHTEMGFPFTIVRPYNWFGPRMDYIPGRDGEGVPRVLACFMTALMENKPLQLVDGGTAYRTITYIGDAVDALVRMLAAPEQSKGQFFNVGNRADGEVTVAELAELMREIYAEITGDARFLEHPIETVSGEAFYGPGYEDCDRRVPDVSSARERLGWEARTSLRDTLRVTMKYFHDAYATAQPPARHSQRNRLIEHIARRPTPGA